MKYLILLFVALNSFALDMKAIKKKYNLTDEKIGAFFYDTRTNKELFSHNAKKKFIPASTFKIFTAYYLLKKLGPDFRFKTQARLHDNNLILSFDGDPYLLSTDIINMAYAIKEKIGKKKIVDIIITSNFPSLERIGDVGLDDQPYNQGISGINLNFNRFKAVKAGDNYIELPHGNFLELTKAKEDHSPGEIFKRQDQAKKEAWTYQSGQKYFYEVPIRNAFEFNKRYLLQLLQRVGIKFQGNVLHKSAHYGDVIYEHRSKNLVELLGLAMEYSNNLFMETLLIKATNRSHLKGAAREMKHYLVQNVRELDLINVRFENGSGLTLNTEVHPSLLAKFLAKTQHESFNGKRFITLFSLAGHSGFLAKRYYQDHLYESFFAKTGSLDYVNGLCGIYFKKENISFCVYINHDKNRFKLTGKNTKEKEILRQSAKAWKRVTDQALENIISDFFKSY